MSSDINRDAFLNLALRELVGNGFSGDWDIERKAKTLDKFGRRDNLGTTRALLWQGTNLEEKERGPDDNTIDTFSSSSALDVGQVVNIEGHYGDGNGNLVFTAFSIISNGQNKVSLPIALSRCSRMAVPTGSTKPAGDLWVYEDGTITGGVPDNPDNEANVVRGTLGDNQSFKAQTSVSGLDCLILTQIVGSINKKTAGQADIRIERRLAGETFFRPISGQHNVNSSGSTFFIDSYKPYGVIPPNADVRMTGIGSTTNEQVNGAFRGVFANRRSIPS